jgi:DNA-directed RNA polymerase subunit M/transcription elongation factor TFIIS
MYDCPECHEEMIPEGSQDDGKHIYHNFNCQKCDIYLTKTETMGDE